LLPSHVDPLALFRAAVAAVNAEDWSAAAALCDPVSLRAFHRQLVAQFAPPEPRWELTVDELLRHAPEMPRAVAEYQVAEHRRHIEPTERLRQELPGVPDLAALAALSAKQAFAAWLDGRSVSRQVERLAATRRITRQTAELLAAGPTEHYPYVPLGVVPDGERVVHVLFRRTFDAGPPGSGDADNWLAGLPADEQELARELWGREHPQVATCRRQPDGTWRLVADYDFLRISSQYVSDVREGEAREEDSAGAV
jgi:hypothetical protein